MRRPLQTRAGEPSLGQSLFEARTMRFHTKICFTHVLNRMERFIIERFQLEHIITRFPEYALGVF